MAVTLLTFVPWPNSIIPYTVKTSGNPAPAALSEAIREFNERIEFDLFCDMTDPGQPYAVFDLTMPGMGDSPIGFQNAKFQNILVRDGTKKWTILHEMAHCAGLGHEIYHSRFPFETAQDAYYQGSAAIFKNKLVDSFKKNKTLYLDITPFFDQDSIMLYNDWRTAARISKPRLERLTMFDVAAIHRLYPSRPDPVRFIVSVQGGSADDSLVLDFEVRAAGASLKGKTSALGLAAVRGHFQPETAEIRFEGSGPGSTRVVLGRKFMLPGGRYTFICR